MVNPFQEIRNFDHEDFRMQNFIQNNTIKDIANNLPLISFIIANLFIILIFEYFFETRAHGFLGWSIYIIGLFFSFAIIKTNLLLKFSSNTKKKSKEPQVNINKEKREKIEYILSNWNTFLISSRTLFFNVLNDLFISTLFWTAFFGILYAIYQTIGIVTLPQQFNFIQFLGIITMISLMSGFFQLYIPSYQRNITEKIQNSLNNFIIQNIQSVSPWDFQKYLESNKNDKNQELIKKISDIIGTKNLEKLVHASSVFLIKGRGNFNSVNVFNLESPATKDPIMVFVTLENIIENEHPILLDQFQNEMKTYFGWKHNEYLNIINNLELDEIRKIIFANIIFFDETFASYINLNFKSLSIEKGTERFQDYFLSYVYACIFDFFNILINDKIIR